MAASRQRADLFSTKLMKVAERARRDPEARFDAIAYLIDEYALTRAYEKLRKGAAVGVDGVKKEQYGEQLGQNIRNLHGKLRTKRWRHQPIRRAHIPKGKGRTRPIGVSCIEDKIVQNAVGELLEVVYEPLFSASSYGFRPGRSAHEAVQALNQAAYEGRLNWVLEADIQAYFDSIDRKMLMEMIRNRVADGSLIRLIGKCLHVGILEGAEYSEPEEGTVQGSTLSPLLGNIYLHYVLDEWFERDVQTRLKGRALLVRFADDFVIGFERKADAERVMDVLHKRLGRYKLTLHPDKTRLVPFERPKTPKGKGPGTFDFVGFTFYWGRTRRGQRVPRVKTRKASLRRFIKTTDEWCQSHRHLSVKEQHAALKRRIEGHFQYFGVNGNLRCLWRVTYWTTRTWRKWLGRRSQRARINWVRMNDLLREFPMPKPFVRKQIW